MGKRSIPHINVTDTNLRLILQSMKERIESTPDTTTVIGKQGDPGQDGNDGDPGTNGVGVPVGGTTGQVLTKASATDYDTTWVTPTGGGGTGGTPAINSFTPTTNQTVFNLTQTPIALTTHVLINQANLQYGSDYTISGTTLTLQPSVGYSLTTTDAVQIYYYY